MITDLPEIVPPPRWTKGASCASGDYDPDDWFPVPGTPEYFTVKDRAVAICRKCPVQLQCLRHALHTETDIWGIRGGQSQHQRAKIRGRLKRLGRRS